MKKRSGYVNLKKKHAKTQKYDASVVHQAKKMMGTP
jgi:hypothetical protein